MWVHLLGVASDSQITLDYQMI
uniref:Uncharacterized protein n=1 Tax=Arundo donax TaxID=35708 RepID=A0A0A8ZP11_ARUDO